jgi:hypothetical protein
MYAFMIVLYMPYYSKLSDDYNDYCLLCLLDQHLQGMAKLTHLK